MPKKDTQFKKGQSGNPAGRPKGSRNKASLAVDALLEGEAEALTRKAVEMALAGDTAAMRLCLERVCPVRRERPITLDLPKVDSTEAAVESMAVIIETVASGELTPGEGQTLASLVETQRRVIETEELERRVAELERRQGENR